MEEAEGAQKTYEVGWSRWAEALAPRRRTPLKRKQPLLEVDPLCLPLGMQIGRWRVTGFRGRGAYGTLYRVECIGREDLGPFALKLAIHPRDKRFPREARLLSTIRSPFVPRLHDQGTWEHPSGSYPYVVMDLIDGEPLYDWAARRNPSERQLIRLLAQVARALEATHAVGGTHRDVKGDNVLVRRVDGQAFLTDFGAGHYRGAATLTSKLLPPGTPAYRSPEMWGFINVFRRHPTAHYPASACDDLFALGVTAYRLVTDEYPPSTHPEGKGSEVWREGGPGPRPPRQLHPRVSPELEAIILRLLSVAPEERFQGRAGLAAEALEQAAEHAGPTADAPHFSWGDELRPRWRSPEAVRLSQARDEAAREELAKRALEKETGARADREQAVPPAAVRVWGAEAAVSLVGLLLACLAVAVLYRGQGVAQGTSDVASLQGDIVAVGDSASTAPAATLAPMLRDGKVPVVGLPMPEKPFPGQRTPPCDRHGEVVLRGGCWYELARAMPPCKGDAYEWKGACYLPSFPPRRQPASNPP